LAGVEQLEISLVQLDHTQILGRSQ
jgi:hypothetical protein